MSQHHLDNFKSRPLSWSSISSWEFNREQWARKYLENIYEPDTEELIFGKEIDERIQKDPTFLPNMPRFEEMQYKMKVNMCGIELVGIPDGVNFKKNKQLADFKTGKKEWNKKRAQETGQLLFYLLLIYITHKIRPEEFDCFIYWLPTKLEESGNFERKISLVDENDFKPFKVKHTLVEVLNFGSYLKKTYEEMSKYALEYSQ